jgi:hypothetical protein
MAATGYETATSPHSARGRGPHRKKRQDIGFEVVPTEPTNFPFDLCMASLTDHEDQEEEEQAPESRLQTKVSHAYFDLFRFTKLANYAQC